MEYNFIVCYFLLIIMFFPAKVSGYVNFMYLSILLPYEEYSDLFVFDPFSFHESDHCASSVRAGVVILVHKFMPKCQTSKWQ